MTGAEFPADSPEWDAVIKIEDTVSHMDVRTGDMWIEVVTPVIQGQNRRRRGEQVQPGDLVLTSGEVVTPEKVLLLASTGVRHLEVIAPIDDLARGTFQRRRIGVIPTGKEVVDLDDIGGEPRLGQVIDTVTPYLRGLLGGFGFDVEVYPRTGDDAEALAASAKAALGPSIPAASLRTRSAS
jgi:molybdopterin molybdotransferase